MNFSGVRIVLTGTPSGRGGTRKHVEATLRSLGAIIQNKIDLNTDMLIFGRADTVKYREAQNKGVRTVSYDELNDHLSNGTSLGEAMQTGAKKRQTRRQVKKADKALKTELSQIQSTCAGW